MKYLAICAALISVFFLGRFTTDAFKTRGTIYQTVNNDWTIKLDNQILENATLPLSLDHFTSQQPGAKATLIHRLDIPKQCSSIPCYLFFGEVGDLAKVSINGKVVKVQGYADGYHSLAKHHPLWVDLPAYLKSSALIQLEIESMYGVGFGISKGPIFIGDYAAVTSHERILTLESVTFPLMQTLVLSILGLLAFVCWRIAKLDSSVFKYGLFAITEAAFMLSFSYLPREYLSVDAASAIHFILRLISDWALFECINSLLRINKTIRYSIRVGYAFFMFWVSILFLKHASYPEFVSVVHISGLLMVGVPFIGVLSSIYYWRESKTLPTKRNMDVELLGITFGVLTVLQLWDTSVFWGIFSGTYLVKFYLSPLALMLAIVHVKRHIRHYELLKRGKLEAEKDAVLGRIAMEFSHDLKSPLGSLRDWSLKALEDDNPEFTKIVLTEVAAKTTMVSKRLQELFNYAKEEIQEKQPTLLREFIKEIEAELNLQLSNKNLKLHYSLPERAVQIDSASFKRAVINLIENAIQASPQNGSISINAKTVRSRLIFSVQDFGVGIAEENLSQVFEPYFTTNKPQGTGLGLAIVDRITRQHGGHVQVFSKIDVGSTFVLEIPQ